MSGIILSFDELCVVSPVINILQKVNKQVLGFLFSQKLKVVKKGASTCRYANGLLIPTSVFLYLYIYVY